MALKPISLANLTRAIEKLKDYFVQIKDAVKSVNGNEPDANGNILLDRVDWAADLESSSTQSSRGTFTIRTAGGGSSINSGSAWLMNIHGNSVKTGFVQEVLDMTVEAIPREEGEPITAVVDADTFWAAVASGADSGTITLTFTTVWSTNPASLGVTVTGTPIAGDQIVIDYVKGNRGTITNATPSAFVSTGWNLYDHAAGYARVVRYSEDDGWRIDGTYTAVKFSETLTGTQEDLTVTSGLFQLPEGSDSGYVWVTGGNNSSTAIYPTWGDWTEGYPGSFQAFTSTSVSLSNLMSAVFPNGMMSVGTTYDEINLNIGSAIQRIDRWEYNTTNLEAAIASGRDFDTDEDYIYIVMATPQQTSYTISGAYTANDHGLEWFEGSSVDVYAQTVYGASLKNKLERDVLTISQQTLTTNEKNQVKTNIGAADATAFANYMKFKHNDTYGVANIPCTFPGILTNGQKSLMFTIQIPWSMENINTITVTSLNGSVRTPQGYLGSGNVDLLDVEGYTWYARKAGNYMVDLQCSMTTAQSSFENNSNLVLTTNAFALKFTKVT